MHASQALHHRVTAPSLFDDEVDGRDGEASPDTVCLLMGMNGGTLARLICSDSSLCLPG
jgi:hypothetical protein